MSDAPDREGSTELPPPGPLGLPLSAPVAADVLPGRMVSTFAPHPTVPAQPPAPAAASVRPASPPAGGLRPAGWPSGDAAPPEDVPAPASPPPAGQAAAVGRGGHDFTPEFPAQADHLLSGSSSGEPPEDPNRVILRKHLDALRLRAANASSWLEASGRYARLINRDGIVPVTARLTRDDLQFLGRAREEVLGFAELGLRLLELHAPLDAGGISTDPSSPILRCRSCMWRWPCPTFRMLTDALIQLSHPGPPPAR